MPDLSTVLQINSGGDVSAPSAAPVTTAPTSTAPVPDAGANASSLGLGHAPVAWDASGNPIAPPSDNDQGTVLTIHPRAPTPDTTGTPPVAGPSVTAPAPAGTVQLNDPTPNGKIAFTQALLAAPKDAQATVHPSLAQVPAGQSALQPGQVSGVPANFAAGFNQEAANAIGLPAALLERGYNVGASGINALTGAQIPVIPERYIGGELIQRGMGIIGADPGNVVPTNTAQQVARGAGAGGAAVLAPVAAARSVAAGALGDVSPVVQRVAETMAAPSVPGQVAIGAVGGATGQAASELAPEPYKGVANFAGNLIGGTLAGATGAAVNSLARGAYSLIKSAAAPINQPQNFIAKPISYISGVRAPEAVAALPDGTPVTATPGQTQLARQRLLSSATDLEAVRNTLDQASSGELVPGSTPTTAQLTGDPGMLALERAQATKSPAPFAERRNEQAQARWNAINALAPEDVDPFFAREFFGTGVDQVAKATADRVASLRASADKAAENLRSGDPFALRDLVEAKLREIDTRYAGAVAAAKNVAREKAEALGQPLPANELGAQMRSELLAGRAAAKEEENKLWNAIDPDRTAHMDAAPIADTAETILGDMPRAAKRPSGEEQQVFEIAQGMKGVEPFREITALRSRITDEMQAELQKNGRSEIYRRLALLLKGVDGTISGALERQAETDAGAVAAGTASEDETMTRQLARQASEWYGARGNAVAEGANGRGTVEGAGRNAGAGQAAVRRMAGTEGEGRGEPGVPPGDQGVPPEPGVDEGVRERYAAAKASTRERASTFDEGPVGAALKPGTNAGGFNRTDSQVASTFFRPGDKSFDDVQAYMAAVGDSARAQTLGRDYLASKFREAAIGPDGAVDPAKAAKFIADYQGSLRHFPQLQAQFADAAKAADTARAVAIEHQAQVKAFETGAARNVIGTDPQVSVRRVMASEDPAASMRDLIAQAKGSAPAVRSLQANLADWLISKAGADGTKLSSVIDDPKTARAIEAAFSPNQVKILKGIADAYDEAASLVESQTAAAKAFQEGPGRYFLDADPMASIERVMKSQDPAGAINGLMGLTAGNAEAQASIRAAFTDWLKARISSVSEAGSSGLKDMLNGSLQKLVTDPKALRALEKIYTPEQMQSLRAVAADVLRANRTATAVKLPGSPGTAQDLTAATPHGTSPLSTVVAAELGGEALQHVGGPLTKAAGLIGTLILNGARSAGLQKVDDLVTLALLHPEIGKALIEKMPPKPPVSIGTKLAGSIGNVLASEVPAR